MLCLFCFSHISTLISSSIALLDSSTVWFLCVFPEDFCFVLRIPSNSCLHMPRRKAFLLMLELCSLTSNLRLYSCCFLYLKWLSFPNPAEVFFLFQGLFKTSFLPGAILSVPHLLARQWNSSPYFLELCLSVVFYDTHLHIWFIPLQTSSCLYSSTAPHRMNWNQCPTRDFWNELTVLRTSFCCSYVNT